MKSFCVVLILSGALILYSCQENPTQNDEGNNTVSQDSATTGLEGTRDQSGTIGGTDVKVDPSSGQNTGKQSGDSTVRKNKAGRDTIPR
ncbi:MAG: hypothetical protein WKF97_16685 [Chitinophagaceae bacterium]